MKRSIYKLALGAIVIVASLSLIPAKLFAVDVSTVSNIDFPGNPGDTLSLVASGDVNGDSIQDLVFQSYSGNGTLYIIFGTSSQTLGTRPIATASNYNIRLDGGAIDFLLGIKVADVNGDGLGDLIINSPDSEYNGPSSGAIYILFSTFIDDFGTSTGNNLSLDTPADYNIRFDGAANDFIEGQVIGDINSDGDNDMLIGAIDATYGGTTSGSIYAVLSTLIDDYNGTNGNNLDFSTSTNYNIRYDSRIDGNAGLERSIAIGDINGDSLNDISIGAFLSDINGSDSGETFIIFSNLITAYGASTGNIVDLTNTSNYNIDYRGDASPADSSQLGYATFIGDVDGDSKGDLIIYSHNWIYVFASTLIDNYVSTGNNVIASTGSNFNLEIQSDGVLNDFYDDGFSIIHDVNGDGLNDLSISAALSDNNGVDSGSVFILFSSLIDNYTGGTGNILNIAISSSFNIRYDGENGSVTGLSGKPNTVGDVNTDGKDDLLMFGYQADTNGTDSGAIYENYSTLIDDAGTSTGNVFNLANSSSYSQRFDGAAGGDLIGGDVISFIGDFGVGDYNNDGLNDIAMSSQNANSFAGGVWVVMFQGSLITNLDSVLTAYLANDNSTDVSVTRQTAIQNIRVFKGSTPIAEVSVDFPANSFADKNWGSVSADTDTTLGKSFTNSLFTAEGVNGTVSLYIPITLSTAGGTVVICPNAFSLSEVSLLCPNRVEFANGQTQNVAGSSVTVTQENILGIIYWKATGNTAVGGISKAPVIVPPPAGVGSPGPTSFPTSFPTNSGGGRTIDTSEDLPVNTGKINPDIIDISMNILKNEAVRVAPEVLLGALAVAYIFSIGAITLGVFGLGGTHFGLDLFLNILRILGLLPKKRKQGYVYSTDSKNGISLALVDIIDARSNRYISSMITDFDGSYYEPYLEKGSYLFKARQAEYSFPTQNQRPAGLSVYDYYKGENVAVITDRVEQAIVVPMDQHEQWMTSQQGKDSTNIFWIQIINVLNWFVIPFWVLSVLVALTNPDTFNIIIAAFYTILILFRVKDLLKRPSLNGIVTNRMNGNPVHGAVVQLKDRDGQLIGISRSDKKGEYEFFVPRGKYSLFISSDGYISGEGIGSSIRQVNLGEIHSQDFNLTPVV
ncbi:MAG: carboxypeptidase-like regulatory domain-containing protein [Candidatus Dojkabacteria bacterium]